MREQESPKKNDFVNDISKSLKEEWKKDEFGQKVQRWKDNIITFINSLRQVRNIVENNYELGKKHYESSNFDDAIFRFKFLTWMDPKHADGWYWLARSYIAVDKKQNAKLAIRKVLEIKPDFQEAKELLKAASGSV